MRKTDKLKICQIIPKFSAGGAEQLVLELAKEYIKLGHEASIISLSSGGNMINRFKEQSIKIHELAQERKFSFSFRWIYELRKSRQNLVNFFLKEKFDVVHTHLKGPDVDCFYSAKKANIPVIIHTVHNTYKSFASKALSDKIKNWLRKKTFVKYDKVFAVDNEVKKWAVENNMLKADRISIIQNGIDFSRLQVPLSKSEIREKLGWKEDEIIILNVGRLTEQKNQVTLIQAIPYLLKQGLNSRLFIAGEGPLRDMLRSEISQLELTNKVKLLGYRNDIPMLLNAADIFTLPSHWEGLPIVLLEALGAGIYTVASNIPVHRKLLNNERIGLICDQKDPEMIAMAIYDASKRLNNIEEAKHLAKSRIIDEYSSQKMATEYLKWYIEILKSKSLKNLPNPS